MVLLISVNKVSWVIRESWAFEREADMQSLMLNSDIKPLTSFLKYYSEIISLVSHEGVVTRTSYSTVTESNIGPCPHTTQTHIRLDLRFHNFRLKKIKNLCTDYSCWALWTYLRGPSEGHYQQQIALSSQIIPPDYLVDIRLMVRQVDHFNPAGSEL